MKVWMKKMRSNGLGRGYRVASTGVLLLLVWLFLLRAEAEEGTDDSGEIRRVLKGLNANLTELETILQSDDSGTVRKAIERWFALEIGAVESERRGLNAQFEFLSQYEPAQDEKELYERALRDAQTRLERSQIRLDALHVARELLQIAKERKQQDRDTTSEGSQSKGDSGLTLFSEKIRPVLLENCGGCHAGGNSKGGLALDTREQLLKGGRSGPAVVPGDADSSLLFQLVTHQKKPEMPLGGKKLSDDVLAAIRAWIEADAPYDGELNPTGEGRKKVSEALWSQKPLSHPEVPQIASDWVRTPIDRFILAKLNEHNLTPSPEADRRTLIRRLYFDLHGLPPTPEEVERFVNDPDPLAFERLVDRLLESPRYGERWARHWLDVAQYGETHGYDKDKKRNHSWPYRDYVIRAFNEDKPYSRFIEEQIAGDVLYPTDPNGVVAAGFIAAGPWDFVGHAELREGTVDKKITRLLDRDNMVTTVMSSFMSLTVHCARCHDHKFDPITQEDYYQLQAVFAGIDRADRPFDPDPAVHQQRRALTEEKKALEPRLEKVNGAIASVTSAALQSIDLQVRALREQMEHYVTDGSKESGSTRGYQSAVAEMPYEKKWVQVDLGSTQSIDEIVLIPAENARYGYAGPGYGFPERFRIEVSNDAATSDAQCVADETHADFPNPADRPYRVTVSGVQARFVRLEATQLFHWNGESSLALAELLVISNGSNIALNASVTASDTSRDSGWKQEYLVDGISNLTSFGGREQSLGNGYHSAFAAQADIVKWVQIDLGESKSIDRIRLYPARPIDFQDTPGFGFPVRFRIELSDDPEFKNCRLLADYESTDVVNPGEKPFAIAVNQQSGRYVRLTATRLWWRGDEYLLALAEMQVESKGENVAENAAVTSLDSIDSGRWNTTYLVDGFSSREKLFGEPESGDTQRLNALLDLHDEIGLLHAQRMAQVEMLVPDTVRTERDSVGTRLAAIERELSALPEPQLVYAASSDYQGIGNFNPPGKPRTIYLLQRGDVNSPVREVQPAALQFLDSVPGMDHRFTILHPDEEGERRVALARWIANPCNPYTWRSIVNRVWHYHFGKGIVDTPNDFGHMGSKPTHPELLDWLASEFLASGQSIKWLHRLICTSAVYRQISDSHEVYEAIDGGNQYLWRMNRQRLDAECIRDSVLQITGLLDLTMGGPSVEWFRFEDDHSPRYLYNEFDVDDPRSYRRSVYRLIVRSVPDPFMETMDCADPSQSVPVRNETLTALQALSLLNNPFMVRQAERFAERVQGMANDLAGRIDTAYRLALSRHAAPEELELMEQYAEKHGLANACRLIFNCNEFHFVD